MSSFCCNSRGIEKKEKELMNLDNVVIGGGGKVKEGVGVISGDGKI